MNREFKGVWVPKEIWLNEDMSLTEKMLFVEIDSLAKNGECFATNDYFDKFLGLSKDRISKLITSLHRRGFVSVELVYKKESKEIDKRIIRPIPLGHITEGGRTNHLGPQGEITEGPLGKNAEDINTSFNNTINNTINNTRDKKTNKKSLPIGALESEFETLWNIYPKKEGKANALKSYIKARKDKDYSYETIENGLYRYIDYLRAQETERKYIMMGSTWFNGEKWLDEYISIAPQKKIKNFYDYYQSLGGDRNESNRNGQVIDFDPIALSEPNEKFGRF